PCAVLLDKFKPSYYGVRGEYRSRTAYGVGSNPGVIAYQSPEFLGVGLQEFCSVADVNCLVSSVVVIIREDAPGFHVYIGPDERVAHEVEMSKTTCIQND